MNKDSAPSYRHTQNAPWFLLLLGPGVLMLGFVWVVREEPILPIVLAVAGTLMLVLAASFQHLTVADEGERLAIRFGPLALFQKRIRYDDIRAVEVGRTTLLDGWGIHLSLRGGWVWNIWGRGCVVIRHRATTWVGTDDADNLARFLKTKIPAST